MEKNTKELEESTIDLLNYLHELTYLVEHFVHKSNKSTSLDIRNSIRGFKDIANNFRAKSINFFKDEEDAGLESGK